MQNKKNQKKTKRIQQKSRMSLVRQDARAAIPSEYSDTDPRNPNNLVNASLSQMEQIVADSSFDNKQKKSIRCQLQEEFQNHTFKKQHEPYMATAALSIFALLALIVVARVKILHLD